MPLPLARLDRRNRQPEIIDDPALDAGRLRDALRGLARINWWSRSDAILWRPIKRESMARPLRVLDLATGGGDVPIRLWQRVRRAGLPIELAGADINPTAIEQARDRAKRLGAAVDFFVLDAIHEPLPNGYDVLTCSLFLHHLDEGDALTLLGKMGRAARRLVLVNDLIRGRLGYLLAWTGTRLLTRSPIVHVDGPRSVEAAFTPAEAAALAQRAGLTDVRAGWRWPFRFLLEGRPAT